MNPVEAREFVSAFDAYYEQPEEERTLDTTDAEPDSDDLPRCGKAFCKCSLCHDARWKQIEMAADAIPDTEQES